MATRWYLAADTISPERTNAFGGTAWSWDQISSSFAYRAYVKRAAENIVSSVQSYSSDADTSATTDWDVAIAQFHTTGLFAQTLLSGSTFTCQALWFESSSNMNAYAVMFVKHYNSSHTLLNEIGYAIGATELNSGTGGLSSCQNRTLVVTTSGDITISNGDYFVFELGFRAVNTKSTTYTSGFGIEYHSVDPDAGNNETDTDGAAYNGWIECSQSIIPYVVQEGFRFRNDNGSESTATWNANQDTNISLAAGGKIRLRFVLDTQLGDSSAREYRLEYRKTGTSTWYIA